MRRVRKLTAFFSLAGVRAVADDGTLLAEGVPGSFFPVEPLGVEAIGAGERADCNSPRPHDGPTEAAEAHDQWADASVGPQRLGSTCAIMG